MKVSDLPNLYVHSLRDLYSAENQLIAALPSVADAVSDEELRTAIFDNIEETQVQVERLENIFRDLGEDPTGQECVAMKGLIQEANELIDDVTDPQVRDAALIGAAQKVEHYKIASYGTARTLARVLGKDDHADILNESLQEEGACDHRLTDIAEESINLIAKETRTSDDREWPIPTRLMTPEFRGGSYAATSFPISHGETSSMPTYEPVLYGDTPEAAASRIQSADGQNTEIPQPKSDGR